MAVKKIEQLNAHRDVYSTTEQFDVQNYLNKNWDDLKDIINNNADELTQTQTDVETLKADNTSNKEKIDNIEKSNEDRDGKISKNTEDIKTINKSLENINKKDNEQDEDIKANKESIELLQTENKKINAENERLREDIKIISIQGETSGENIHIEDSSNARCELEICGNQEQETRAGYNQLKNEATTQTLNNVTITKKEDGTLVVNGTAAEDFTFSIKRNTELEDGEQYRLSGCPNGGAEKKYALTINQYYENQLHFWQDYGDGVNFTYNGSLPINNDIYIRLFKGITYNNLIFKPMIVKGTEQKPYEQYGASPSIDYPNEVKSVGNDVNLLNPNTFNNVKGTSINDEKILIDTTSNTSNANLVVYNNIGLEDDTYSIIAVLESGKYAGGNIVVRNADGQTIGEFSLNDGKKIVTGNIKDIVLWNVTNATNCILKIKISKEKETKGYSKYGMGSAKIDIENEDLFNSESVQSTSAIDVVDNKNGVLELQGKSGYWASLGAKRYFEVGKKVYVKCKTLLLNEGASSVLNIMDSNGNSITENHKINGDSITCDFISKGLTTINFRCNGNSNAGHIKYYDIMVSYEDTDYVQHEEQSYSIDVQQEMLEGDKFVKQKNKWYEKHCWGKRVLTGDVNFVGYEYGENSYKFYFTSKFLQNEVTVLSNCFFGVSYDDRTKASNNTIYSDGGAIYIRNTKFTDVDTLKAKLKELYDAGTPVIIYYLLEEPVLLECTEAQTKVLNEIYNKAHTYKNITNILAESAEVNPILNVKYLKDTETEHNKLQSQIDEIKQLLSTTQTSSLLLDNMQKDLESEV